MTQKKILCSLSVLNLKEVTRLVGSAILGPNRGGVVHFYDLKEIKSLLKLQENRHVEIRSEIPSHVLLQLNGGEQPIEPKVEVAEPKIEVEVKEAEPKPKWYLTFEEVESMNKGDLIEWSEQLDDLKLTKNKNAGEIKKMVHEYLNHFEDVE